jgi:SAM-dependent methyltransferase
MPLAELQINTVGQSGAGAMEEAWLFAVQCLARFRNAANWANPSRNLLDFGTGWARIARCFLRDFDAENIIGVDVDPDFIALCSDTFHGPRFLRCSPFPPLEIETASVDFIVGYSVFSHLSESACWQWINEFARILRPEGMAALTTRGRWFFDYAAGVTGTDTYAVGLAAMFPNFDDAKAQYDNGEFVHSRAYGVAGGGAREGDFYGETFIPEQYAREILGKALPLIEFYQGDNHPIMFFQKDTA